MNFKRLLTGMLAAAMACGAAHAADVLDAEGYPEVYVRGDMTGSWSLNEAYHFTRTGDTYDLTINGGFSGDFKIATEDWSTINYGAPTSNSPAITGITDYAISTTNNNITASIDGEQTVNLRFVIAKNGNSFTINTLRVGINGEFAAIDPDDPDDPTDPYSHYPVLYIRGEMTGSSWPIDDAYKFTRQGNVYTLAKSSLNGQFKISDANWGVNFGAPTEGESIKSISGTTNFSLSSGGKNITAQNLSNVTLSFTLHEEYGSYKADVLKVTANSGPVIEDPIEVNDPSEFLTGTLPVLYINVYTDETHSALNNEIIDRNLSHKNYFTTSEYWIEDPTGTYSVGSKEEPLALEVKARGNYTRTGFSKKPFKLKLGAKTALLGMSKSKHFAILAHADDNFGYMRNFTGFWLGRKMGLPWTPDQRPVEVVINGDYRGLYFLTESIRVGDGRVPVESLDDNTNDPALISGGYLVELDNYDEPEESQIQMTEKTCVGGYHTDKLRITFDTPEEYSTLMRRFVNEQFTAMNDAVGVANSSDELWKYMDLDDAARYYLVEEIISHTESYHGSTYLFRDRGEGQKWHFSPLWDCGNAFNGPTNNFFYNGVTYGNTWIPSIRANGKFNDKVRETWAWFMNKEDGYSQLEAALRAYAAEITPAAAADHKRWKDEPLPNSTGSNNPSAVIDNTDMNSRLGAVLSHLSAKTNWLKGQFGDYTQNPTAAEPERDATEAAPLPEYAKEGYEVDLYEGYPELYVRGTMTGGTWPALPEYKFTRKQNVYTLELESLDGDFKISDAEWGVNFGAQNAGESISGITDFSLSFDGKNIKAVGLQNVTLRMTLTENNGSYSADILKVGIDGLFREDMPVEGLSGTLPVLYINVYTDETKTAFEDEIIDRNLSHKNYFVNAEYWLDLNGCEWMAAEGATSVGSKEEPLPLQIKARGNYTRTGFSKKPFKLKLGSKQSLLGLSKSKHFAILAHADDNYGYMRNFTGFWLGRAIGLPWAPGQQPVEVVINGNYRGLYFLTESIRVESGRVDITALDDNESTPALISGGYVVELDNYEEESNQLQMEEKTCVPQNYTHKLLVTFDTPEEYSSLQKQFISEQFTAMNNAVGTANTSDELWKYMDLDDAARYYLVEEIISHYEAYHGSTYLFRDRGEGQKWHFSPLWDCGHAFDGDTNNFFYNYYASYGNTWIASIRTNSKFNDKVRETWTWFMNKEDGYKQLEAALRAYAGHIAEAAKADRARWKDEPMPNPANGNNPSLIVDNSDMDARLNAVLSHLSAKTTWLKGQFGDYTQNPTAAEPERDTTEAAPLPAYAREDAELVEIYFNDTKANPWSTVYAYTYYEVAGQPVVELLGAWPGTEMTLLSMAQAPSRFRNTTTTTDSPLWKVTLPVTDVENGHNVIFNDGTGGTDHQTADQQIGHLYVYGPSGIVTGVDSVSAESAAAVRYYNLQGVRIDTPAEGEYYIEVRGDKGRTIRY
ncbi:MAG: CotH kinase family protein [Muribaculaceae bacterium]|nr:CotH kinase family protein [Muribaculaceae bacterium]